MWTSLSTRIPGTEEFLQQEKIYPDSLMVFRDHYAVGKLLRNVHCISWIAILSCHFKKTDIIGIFYINGGFVLPKSSRGKGSVFPETVQENIVLKWYKTIIFKNYKLSNIWSAYITTIKHKTTVNTKWGRSCTGTYSLASQSGKKHFFAWVKAKKAGDTDRGIFIVLFNILELKNYTSNWK